MLFITNNIFFSSGAGVLKEEKGCGARQEQEAANYAARRV